MAKPCNCINNFNEKLAPEQELETSLVFSRSGNSMSLQTFTSLMRKDTGNRENRRSKPRIAAHTFCPFCGASMSGDWRPYLGQPVQATEALLERFPEYRGETYFIAGIGIERRGGYPVDGLNITITEDWPVTSKTLGFTDEFYINRAGKADDLEPIRLNVTSKEGQTNG